MQGCSEKHLEQIRPGSPDKLVVDNFCPSIFKSKAMEGEKHIKNMIHGILRLSEIDG